MDKLIVDSEIWCLLTELFVHTYPIQHVFSEVLAEIEKIYSLESQAPDVAHQIKNILNCSEIHPLIKNSLRVFRTLRNNSIHLIYPEDSFLIILNLPSHFDDILNLFKEKQTHLYYQYSCNSLISFCYCINLKLLSNNIKHNIDVSPYISHSENKIKIVHFEPIHQVKLRGEHPVYTFRQIRESPFRGYILNSKIRLLTGKWTNFNVKPLKWNGSNIECVVYIGKDNTPTISVPINQSIEILNKELKNKIDKYFEILINDPESIHDQDYV